MWTPNSSCFLRIKTLFLHGFSLYPFMFLELHTSASSCCLLSFLVWKTLQKGKVLLLLECEGIPKILAAAGARLVYKNLLDNSRTSFYS